MSQPTLALGIEMGMCIAVFWRISSFFIAIALTVFHYPRMSTALGLLVASVTGDTEERSWTTGTACASSSISRSFKRRSKRHRFFHGLENSSTIVYGATVTLGFQTWQSQETFRRQSKVRRYIKIKMFLHKLTDRRIISRIFMPLQVSAIRFYSLGHIFQWFPSEVLFNAMYVYLFWQLINRSASVGGIGSF